MRDFVGRERYLRQLDSELARVRRDGVARFVAIRGRRRVGKSRLVQEFCARAGPPYVYFQATRETEEHELARFTRAIGRSTLPAARLVRRGASFQTWAAAIELIASQATQAEPAIVVIDELPYLTEPDPLRIETAFQEVWDTLLDGRAPVMLVVIGSDLAMMERLAEYGRPLHGRPTKEMIVKPFSPFELGQMLGFEPADTLDAYLIAGGFPLVSGSWEPGIDVEGFLRSSLDDPTSALIVDAERMLGAEFPSGTQAREVLKAIGAGERTFTGIGARAGIPAKSLSRSLEILVERKRVVNARRPLSLKRSRETRYVVADPYLRFWFRFIGPAIDEIERDRGQDVAAGIVEQWPTYRGTAIEPTVREAISRMLPDPRFGQARDVGGWWNRQSTIEVDLVGVDRKERPRSVEFLGSIKWREGALFTNRETAALVAQRAHVTGAERSRLVGVSRTGFTEAGLDIEIGPAEIVHAWDRGSLSPSGP